MPSDAEIFANHLRLIFGEESSIQMNRSPNDGGPPISVFVYNDCPEPGMITGVTYGLSLTANPAWKLSRPEMILSVNSNLLEWPCAASSFVSLFRSEKTFRYGDIYTTDVPLTSDTKMDGFLIFAQSILNDDVVSVELNNYKIHFSQFYPIYRQEISIYEKIGLEAFWKHPDFDMYDIQRQPILG